ncbi:MAG TPA: proton-conducting transporter membrane subunit, partial [Gammaproteobacteria bacterium]|nr:proton-conducting transporter membrane subunit [Gammaproteobacteria bacterium]
VGTLLIAVGGEGSLGAGLYYLVHTTLLTAGLFLLVGIIDRQRAPLGDQLEAGAPLAQPLVLGLLFVVAAIGVVGLPPFSGFLGKVLILQAFMDGPAMAGVYTAILLGGLGSLIALARAGTTLFWKQGFDPCPVRAAHARTLVPAAGLVLTTALLAVAAGPMAQWMERAAGEVRTPAAYMGAVLDQAATPAGGQQ